MTQGTDTKVEGVKRAEEQAKPIQQEEKPAEPKTYTQEELQRAVGKGWSQYKGNWTYGTQRLGRRNPN